MNNKGFMSLLGLIVTMAIIGGMAYFVFTRYLGKPPIDAQTKEAAREAGIDTSNQKTILQSTAAQIKALQTDQIHQSQDMMNSLRE
jgi:hypothetical protein